MVNASGAFGKRRTTLPTFRIRLGLVIVLCSFAAAQTDTAKENIGNGSTETSRIPDKAAVSRAIELATDYLVRNCGPDGKFAYKVEIGTGHESSSYDIIRHEGAMYALSMANRSHPDPKVVAALVRAAGFLRKSYMGPGPRSDQLVVWSKPLDRAREHQHAELGGAGLGMVALAAVREVDPSVVSISDLQALGRFALFLQRDDGSFVNKYDAKIGPVPHWESLYYPGEAALGFIALYEADHSREWLNAAGKALSYLARSRAGLSTVPADHWALIATAKLIPYIEQVTTVSRDELVRHAVQVCNSILREQFRGSAATGLDGAFDPDGRTAPAATRLEGLLAALEFVPGGALREKLEAASDRGIAFLLRAQVTAGPEAGAMHGAGLTREYEFGEVRIDYVQHALCAWLRYQVDSQNKGMPVAGEFTTIIPDALLISFLAGGTDGLRG